MRNRLALVIGYVLSLGLALALGFWRGNRTHIKAEEASRRAQVECLKQMWGRPLTLEQYQRVKALQHDPEAVRAFLLDQADDPLAAATKVEPGPRSQYIPPPDENPYLQAGLPQLPSDYFLNTRAKTLLGLWTPGQTDIRKTANQDGKGIAPLWDLYLSDPTGAFRRGVSGRGDGGK